MLPSPKRALPWAIATTLLGTSAMAQAEERDHLNFVWIVADDLGYGDTGFNGSTEILTPYMDQIAEAGVVMSTAYVSAPVCGPSRAGFHTGRYQHRFGYEGNGGRKCQDCGTATNELMIQEYLQTQGYYTGLVGKFHDGKDEEFQPYNRGFDEYFGFNNGALGYWVEDNENGMLRRNATPVEREEEYLTDAFGRESVDFIRRNADKPFFLEVAFNAPHAPMQAPDEDMARFEHLGQRQTLAAMISNMDNNIGQILKELETQGVAHNTMIVLFADNGGKWEHGGSNGPLRGEKAGAFEGAIRIPFAAKLPEMIPTGTRSDTMISMLDLFPTTVKLAGGEIDPNWELDGKDILPVLSGQTSESPHQRLFWRYTDSWAIRDGDWKLVQNKKEDPGLFNLVEDIGEQNNLLRTMPEKAEELRQTWLEMSTELGPAGWGRFKGRIDRD
ncbi:sulfatase-like hydrolase/transferase [Ferrimonas pelagia]|uniref:Sulfatase N-terminal domain-containing protein n=1 Tax=Ferrimonas pelagia TaxID=1177826 RepID=A0ABP9FL43_9GAMM